ncbi:helix-turn-helix domain-containing protein [Hansschlegelia quercus]|nr:helix-turn-helix domain-containing protein [Hansschlegelia quercus]
MSIEYTADAAPPGTRAQYWSESVSEIFFPLDVEIRDPGHFGGNVTYWDVGPTSLARFASGAVRYRREREHLRSIASEQLLITFALRSGASFRQNDVELNCKTRGFFIQRGNSPYEFEHSGDNELWVVKLDSESLRHRVRSIDRFASQVFDAELGMGALLLDTLSAMPQRLDETDKRLHDRLGSHLIDLLSLALEGDERVLRSGESTVQRAHIGRIERFIRQNLRSRSLTPELIAAECGISVRYLHDLFSGGDRTVGRWIRELRLEECRSQLQDADRRDTIAEIAYRWGFGDHAQFSRHYRAHFGETPRQTRDAGRA